MLILSNRRFDPHGRECIGIIFKFWFYRTGDSIHVAGNVSGLYLNSGFVESEIRSVRVGNVFGPYLNVNFIESEIRTTWQGMYRDYI